VALAFVLVLCVFRFWWMRLRGPMTLERRALWVQSCSLLILTTAWLSPIISAILTF
jgi:uncharacterized membrane protein YdjX (TVP38/TMEM64 family)